MGNLTAVAVKTAQVGQKPRKLTDGDGLYLLLHPNGGKYWRYDYRYLAKRKTLSIGTYPDISLAEAREKHQHARRLLLSGQDPSAEKKLKHLSALQDATNSFEAIANEWYSVHMEGKSKSYQDRTLRILVKDLFPIIGCRPISEITVPELLFALRKIEERTIDIAHRAKQTSVQIFQYACITGRADRNPARELTGALRSRKKVHHPSITDPIKVGSLMRAIAGYQGSFEVKTALQLSPLLFQRPGEIRQMEWEEINWAQRQWEIPASKMKMKVDHIVPLSTQAYTLLEQIKNVTERRGKYVFPSNRSASRCISDNAVRTALRSLGYSNDEMVPHGFRAMARTLLDEQLSYRVDYIEHQLAHAVKDTNGRAYNRTQFLKERRAMMQAWADYLGHLQKCSTEFHENNR